MTGSEITTEVIMLQPMWVTITVQLMTLLIAAGISYGMTRAKLSSNEKDIIALKKDIAQIQTEFQKWQRERLPSVVTQPDCTRMQADCKASICGKIDSISKKIDDFMKKESKEDKQLALIIGAICQKLDIHLPELS